MKLAIYYPRALVGDGGATLSVRGWAKALAGAGVDVAVVCAPGRGGIENVEVRPIQHRRFGRLELPVGLADVVRDADIAWLHSGWVAHNVSAARTLRKLGVPYVLTPHGAYDSRVRERRRVTKKIWWAAFERRLVDESSAVHVFFSSEIHNLREIGYTGATVEAPNGIDVPVTPTWDGGSSAVVLWLGRYDIEHKGLDLLLGAIASIPAIARPHVRLHGTESRDGRARVAGLVTAAGLERFVEVRPPIYGEEKMRALDTALAFVYPSRWDSHSIAMLEAASRGVPLVTTSSTQFGPTLALEGAAFVADPSPESIADALLRGCSERARAVGDKAHSVALERYAWSAVGRSMARNLEDLLIT